MKKQIKCDWILRVLIIALIHLNASGCSSTVTTQLAKNESIPRHLALLPADFSVDIPKERVNTVRAAIASQLRNRSFILADEKIVSRICSSPSCPERRTLASDYMIDGFVTLTINSFSKTGFIAGYYNQLSGRLTISDVNDRAIFSVEHTQSDRGGLLFNSGQIIQGVISQVKNIGDEPYRELAAEFAERTIERIPALPELNAATPPESLEVAVNSIKIEWNSPNSFLICIQGTPKSFASVIIDTQRTTLREVVPGKYCAAFSSLVAPVDPSSTYAELRTAFGNSVRTQIELPTNPPCSLLNRVNISTNTLNVACSSIGRDKSAGCTKSLPLCKAEKIVLYRSLDDQATFVKATESRSSSINIPDADRTYEVVAYGAGGAPSMPLQLEIKSDR